MTAVPGEKLGDVGRIVSYDWRGDPPEWARQGVVAVGNFDGVHLGHAALVQRAREIVQSVGGPVTIITFDPHPLQLLAPARYQPPLTTPIDRAKLLRTNGADAVLIVKTDIDLLHLSAETFFQQILVERLKAKGLVEGFNFRFGRDRTGSVGLLREMCGKTGISLCVVPPCEVQGTIVSSSRVRDALSAGDVRHAARLMNRPYRIRGTVIAGAQRGHTIGFPTANLGPTPTILPGDGVYAVLALVGDRLWAGAANIGPNPTFGEKARKVEVHLLGFTGDLYGQPLAIDFVERLRDTRPFASSAELVDQLNRDIAQVHELVRFEAGGTHDRR